MKKNEKDNLDSYRQERKDRIAKQNKKSGKKSSSHEGAKKTAGKICGIVVSVVLVIAILAASLNFFGVPQRVVKAVTIDGESYAMNELSCYYMQIFNNIYQTTLTYESQYGSGYGAQLTGYNTALSPTEQTTKDDDGNTVTWDEYFLSEAIEQMATTKRYYKAAVEAGVELSEEEKKNVQDVLDSFENSTNLGNYSVSRFISLNYGKGVTKKVFERIITEQQYVEAYQNYRQEELKKNYKDADVEKVYNEDKSAYDVTAIRWFTIDVKSTSDDSSSSGATTEPATSDDSAPLEEEYEAQDFIDEVKSHQNYDEDTFKQAVLDYVSSDKEKTETYKQDNATLLQKISKENVSTNISTEAADWLFEQNDKGVYTRQAGDMKYFLSSDDTAVYIIYALGVPFRDTTVSASVRHILVEYPTEAVSEESTTGEDATGEDAAEETESTTISPEIKSECESEAQSILNDYNDYIEENESGVSDEEYFGELASKLSDDTGSQSAGGLIEDMNNNGAYVQNFEDWVFSEGKYEGQERKEGDTDIVETEYGYHIMYYVGGHDHPDWYETILDDLISEDWEDEQKKFDEKFGEDAIVRKETAVGWVKRACVKTIDGTLG